jgi:hypothetical protein
MITSVLLTRSSGEATLTQPEVTLALLTELGAKSALLMDDQTSAALLTSISAWPHDAFRVRAQRLLGQLRTTGAICQIPSERPGPHCSCGSETRIGPDLVIRGCPGCDIPRSIALSDWILDGVDRMRPQVVVIPEGAHPEELRKQILEPITRYAKSLHVSDRYIAASVAGPSKALRPSQLMGLHTLLEAAAKRRSIETFKITSGLQESRRNRVFPEQHFLDHVAKLVLDQVRNLWNRLNVDWQPKFTIEVYGEDQWKGLHERTISTNLGEIVVDNGIDWISSSSRRCEPRTFTLRKPTQKNFTGSPGTATLSPR